MKNAHDLSWRNIYLIFVCLCVTCDDPQTDLLTQQLVALNYMYCVIAVFLCDVSSYAPIFCVYFFFSLGGGNYLFTLFI